MNKESVIDLDHLDKYVMGDTALRDEILTIFAEQVETLNAQFSETASDDDWKFATHSMKGAARGVGAWVLGDLSEEAEALIGKTPAKGEKRAAIMISIRQQVNAALDDVKRLRGL